MYQNHAHKQLKNFLPEMKKLLITVSGGIHFITLACILDRNSEEPLLLLHTHTHWVYGHSFSATESRWEATLQELRQGSLKCRGEDPSYTRLRKECLQRKRYSLHQDEWFQYTKNIEAFLEWVLLSILMEYT